MSRLNLIPDPNNKYVWENMRRISEWLAANVAVNTSSTIVNDFSFGITSEDYGVTDALDAPDPSTSIDLGSVAANVSGADDWGDTAHV